MWRLNRVKTGKDQGDSLFSGAQNILSALFSAHSFRCFYIWPLSTAFSHHLLSFCFFLLPLKDTSMECKSSCLKLSYRLSQASREKFLAICWIQAWWFALVAHLWLHFLTWHSWLDFISQLAADKLSLSARPFNINLPCWWSCVVAAVS